RGSDEITMLATSREHLGVVGEQLFPLRALGDEAVALFVERARLASPDFEPSATDLTRIVELCRRLDGLPLAIELAAGRIRSHTLDELVDGLANRFQVLRSARHEDGDHHDSMAHALDWSYELLSADEQLVFDRCSVFSGPFTRTAAIDICGAVDLGP